MKKIIFTSLFVAFATTLVFAAPKKSGRIELKIWESSGPESAFIQAAIKEYRTWGMSWCGDNFELVCAE